VAAGTTFKACGCREGGKLLGKQCSRLKRKGGGWSASHGSWYYQLELPAHADGRRRNPVRRGGHASQDAAEAELDRGKELLGIAEEHEDKVRIADLIVASLKDTKALPVVAEVRRKFNTGQELDCKMTMAQWLEGWLVGRKKLRANTVRSYESHLRLYLIPNLGHIRLDRLRVSDVASMFEAIAEYNDLITEARTTGDPQLRAQVKGRRVVEAASQQRIRATLRAALNQAIKERKIDLNVASLVELEGGKRPKALIWTDERVAAWQEAFTLHVAETEARKRLFAAADGDARHGKTANALDAFIGAPRPSVVMVWTPKQTGVFLDQARTHRLYALYHLIAFRGLRRGEGCGLRWPDLDLKTGVVTVRWQIVQLGSETAEGQPKSDAGERHVSLDRETVRELKAHKRRQNADRLAAGEAWVETGFVFTTPTGEALFPGDVTKEFERLAMAAGLPPVRLHDLRHGAATILLAAGYEMKVVQDTLGLSSITIAADTYTSVLPDLACQSAEGAAAIIHNARKTTARKSTAVGVS
jgi:integrase